MKFANKINKHRDPNEYLFEKKMLDLLLLEKVIRECHMTRSIQDNFRKLTLK